ncbi:MAG: aminotransferase class IV [Niabella sp.]
MHMICHNGIFVNERQPVLQASNKGYRYGDGFFETIKVLNGNILLKQYHQKRMEKSIELLDYYLPPHTSAALFFKQILELCEKNNCLKAARIRLSFSNGNGGLFDEDKALNYIIEAWPLEARSHSINENGLITGVFPLMKKSCDPYATIKSSSALLYSLAARYCRQYQWNDCIILNQRENICESSIANLFWITGSRIFTPALTEGCVDGVMRGYLIDQIGNVTETPCREKELLEADEVFLTNAIRGIRWVNNIGAVTYNNKMVRELHHAYIQPLFL